MMSESDNCRLCLNNFNCDTLLSIFPNPTSDGPSLSTKIMICLSLPIEHKTSFSNKICEHCREEIIRFYDFREKCLKTHYSLSRHYEISADSENNNTKNEESDEKIEDQYQEIIPESQKFTNNTSCIVNPEMDISPLLMHQNSSEINSSPKSQLEKLPPTSKNSPYPAQTISLTIDSQNTIYEYKCLHCNNLFSDLDAASMHCMDCTNSPERMKYTSKNTTNPELSNQTRDTEHRDKNPSIKIEESSNPQELKPNPSKQSPKRAKTRTSVECPECSTKFSTQSLLKRHMSIHTRERPFACETCNRRFSQIGQLNFHRKFHLNPRYRCTVCEKPFLRPSDMEKHMRTHTGEKPFTCKICDKSFAQLIALGQHERVHTGDKPYVCEICDKKFSQKANKIKHLKIHKEGAKPHTCGVCGRSFSDYEQMLLHRAGHGGGKPRICDYCDEKFRKISQLSDHIRRCHTFERPHKCAFCSKAFYSLYELKQHVMIHTGQKPFSCAECGLKFTQKGNLKKHYYRKHKNTAQSPGNEKIIETHVKMNDS